MVVIGSALHTVCYGGQEHVGNVGQYKPNGVGLPGGQRYGNLVGRIAQVLRNPQDTVTGLL